LTVFVDSSALVALLDAGDRFSAAARAAWTGLLTSGEPVLSTNYVLVETVAVVQRRLGLAAVQVLYADFLPLLDIHWVSEREHAAALSAVLASGRRRLSLVDCVSFEVMRARGIARAFTFDADFAAAGFESLA
jgi:predicted nucleic acid-binding protein